MRPCVQLLDLSWPLYPIVVVVSEPYQLVSPRNCMQARSPHTVIRRASLAMRLILLFLRQEPRRQCACGIGQDVGSVICPSLSMAWYNEKEPSQTVLNRSNEGRCSSGDGAACSKDSFYSHLNWRLPKKFSSEVSCEKLF